VGGPLVAGVNGFGVLALVAHWSSLWLGLYLVSRRPRFAASVLAGLALMVVSAYLLDVTFHNAPASAAGVVTRMEFLTGSAAFGPALLLHSCMRLTGTRAAWKGWLLGVVYALAAIVFVGGFFNNVINNFNSVVFDAHGYTAGLPPGRYYWVMSFKMVGTLALSLGILIAARRHLSASSEGMLRELNMLVVGTLLITADMCVLTVTSYWTGLIPEVVLAPIAAVGATLVAVSLLTYSGRFDGGLLWADFKASLLAASIAMALFLATAMLLGASAKIIAGLGWVVLLLAVLGDRVQTLGDVFYPAKVRAARLGLRRATNYAGTLGRVDVDALSPEQASALIRVLGELNRAGSTSAEVVDFTTRRLLARAEYAPVRAALGLSPEWTPNDGLSLPKIRQMALSTLPQRDRRALALWHLGYSDKEIARIIGITPNTARSYREEGKKKLGLDTKRSVALYVHLAGFVDSDALPLLESPPRAQVLEPGERSATEARATS
jgi:DNA-binding CsgD family transcriptional regulator